MQNKIFNGDNGLASRTSALAFDCGLNSSERHIVYDDLTPEKLSKWFKDTKYRFPLQIMGQDDLLGWISKEEDGYFLRILRRGQENTVWNLRIGKTITNHRWYAITKFVEDYVSGSLEENYRWNKEHRLALA